MLPFAEPTAISAKAQKTPLQILTPALDLFRRRGFDETSMRGDVAMGAAYYISRSQEVLVIPLLFPGTLPRHAADRRNSLSPFHEETAHIGELDLMHFARALAGSGIAIAKELAPYLPKLIWLHQMTLILFWISDRSAGEVRSRQLRNRSLSLVVTALKRAGFTLLVPLRKRIVELLVTIEGETQNA